jgi:SAM-dependent methyltransferase
MALYAVTIFLSAFLLFQVQPLIAKIILPWFGGSASVWTTCLMFFQVALLLGYLYAHGMIRYLSGKAQALVHIGLLAGSACFLSITPKDSWKPHGPENPALRIVLLLLVTVGLPYFLLSTTGPLLQAWYARPKSFRSDGETGLSAAPVQFPYRLYALSNAGSMLGLLTYPILIEPYFTTHQQSFIWSAGYFLFALLCGAIAYRSRERIPIPSESTEQPEAPRPGLGQRLIWILLSACSCILLLSITNRLTQDIAPIPFLWVVPLSLYLLSFIICFGVKTWEWKPLYLIVPPLTLVALTLGLTRGFRDVDIRALVPQFSLGLFVLCLVCHGELARSKPHPRYLTSFYLMISLGGALGGIFVGLIAPVIYKDYYELQIGIFLCAVLSAFLIYRDPTWNWRLAPMRWRNRVWLLASTAFLTILLGLLTNVGQTSPTSRRVARNFYGVLRVEDSKENKTDLSRKLTHGVINHGEEFLSPDRRDEPCSYYGPFSGVALALNRENLPPTMRVGIVGLGTGTLAAYGRPGDVYRFYEINPLVVEIARSDFYYLKDSKAKIEIALGDARLSMEREPPQNYDVLAIDAFSGDAIPIHLLTQEAFRLYFRHLKPNGVLAVHVSNRYLNLAPVVEKLGASLGKQVRMVHSSSSDRYNITEAFWVLVTSSPHYFDQGIMNVAARPIAPRSDLRLWTDNYSNLFQILNHRSS